jgi:uncharacterized protein (TIRG00374 family)
MNSTRWTLLAAKIALSAALLWLVLTKVDLGGITARLREARPEWLLPAMLLGPLVVVLSAWRWRLLSLGLIKFNDALSYTWIGLFFGSILPGVIGGDVAKGVSLAAKNPGALESLPRRLFALGPMPYCFCRFLSRRNNPLFLKLKR